MFKYLLDRNRELQSRRADEGFDGFTLIELLIVIVVIAILAATVIFALGGVTGSSAQAACNSDAKSMEVAVTAYKAFPGNNDQFPAAGTDLTSSTNAAGVADGGPYLRTNPSSTHYTIAFDSTGAVNVTPLEGANNGKPVNYDTEGAGQGCNGVS